MGVELYVSAAAGVACTVVRAMALTMPAAQVRVTMLTPIVSQDCMGGEVGLFLIEGLSAVIVLLAKKNCQEGLALLPFIARKRFSSSVIIRSFYSSRVKMNSIAYECVIPS